MSRFIEGCERYQTLFLAASIDDYVGTQNPFREIEVFVDKLDLAVLDLPTRQEKSFAYVLW